jgi:two-component system nitrate/nitrite response regulator NarL
MTQRRAHSVRSGARRRRRPKPYPDLTNRRLQVATLVCRGLSNRAVAQKLDLTEGTVKVHLHAIYEKLNIHSRTKLTIALIRSKSQAA